MMHLVVRARATPEIGSGHVMRMASLAEAWVAAGLGGAELWGEVTVPYARRRLESLGVAVTATWEPRAGAADTVLVCDDYDLAARAHSAAQPCALRVLVDDLGSTVDPGFDTVWNPNAYGTRELYSSFGGPVLAGTDAVPVRAGLPRWRGLTEGPTAVMLGGSRLNVSLVSAVKALSARLGVDRLIGAGAWVPPGWAKLDPDDPWRDVAGAGCLVTTSGATVWEAACTGVPAVLVRIAANQDLIFRWATAAGVPGVDALAMDGPPDQIAAALERGIGSARPLPQISNGAPKVAMELVRQARQAAARA